MAKDVSGQEIVTMADEPEPQEQDSTIPLEAKRRSSSKIIYYAIVLTIIIAILVWYTILTTAATRMNPSCGPGLSCMNQSEAISLFGPSGTYKSYVTTDPKTILNLTNDSSITEAWVVVYTIANRSNSIEGVFKTANPRSEYDKILFHNPNHVYYNITNATAGNMTYTAFTYNYNGTIVSLIGYKNGELAEILYRGYSAPSIGILATMVSRDMP